MARKRNPKKIRPTVNNARSGKNGVFLAKHLDGPTGKAAQMNGLLYTWHCYKATHGGDFDWAERYFYKQHFEDGLEYQNKKYRKKGNYNRIRDMDEYRKSVKTCPESTLFYLGDKGLNAGPDLLKIAVMEFLMWREKEYPQVVTIDWALHIEDGAPHVHERKVWIAHDDDGNEIVNQERALEEMGVPRHDEAQYKIDMAEAMKITDKKERASRISKINRFNNRKMTYTEACREKMIEIARSYGLEVEDQAREPGLKGLSQARFKADDERRRAHYYADHANKLSGVVKELQTAAKSGLDSLETQRAEARCKSFLAALGVSMKPAEAVAVHDMMSTRTKTALDAAIEQPGQSGPILSPKMKKVMALAEQQKTPSGPTPVEGPTL